MHTATATATVPDMSRAIYVKLLSTRRDGGIQICATRRRHVACHRAVRHCTLAGVVASAVPVAVAACSTIAVARLRYLQLLAPNERAVGVRHVTGRHGSSKCGWVGG